MYAKRSYEQDVTLGQTSAQEMKIWGLGRFSPREKNWQVGVGCFPRTEPLRQKSTAMVGRRGTPARVGEAVNG